MVCDPTYNQPRHFRGRRCLECGKPVMGRGSFCDDHRLEPIIDVPATIEQVNRDHQK